MGKAIVQVVEAICDRCGAVGDTGYTGQGKAWGELYVEYKGGFGRPFDGNVNMSIKDPAWLCMSCTHAFLSFMRGES